MIFGLVLSTIAIILSTLLNLLPEVSLADGIGGAVYTVTHYLATWNSILPLTTIFTCVGIILLVEAGVLVYRIIDKVRKMFPTQS